MSIYKRRKGSGVKAKTKSRKNLKARKRGVRRKARRPR